MPIHTIMLHTTLDKKSYEKFIKHEGVKYYSKKHSSYNTKDTYKTNCVENGITSIFVIKPTITKSGMEYSDYRLYAVVNLHTLIYGTLDSIDMYNCNSDGNLLKTKGSDVFDKSMREKTGLDDLPTMVDWDICRVDYTIDIKTPFVGLYLKLLNKGNTPYYYDLKSQYKGSSYRQCKSVRMNFYSKEQAFIYKANKYNSLSPEEVNLYDENEYYSNKELLKLSHNILRLEMQYRTRKLHRERSKGKQTDFATLIFISEEQVQNIIFKGLKTVTRTGKYQYIDTAVKKLNDSTLHNTTKEQLESIIKKIGKQNSSVDKVRNDFCNSNNGNYKNPKNTWNSRMKSLDSLNINPVVITRAMVYNENTDDKLYVPLEYRQEIRKNGLPNLCDLIYAKLEC